MLEVPRNTPNSLEWEHDPRNFIREVVLNLKKQAMEYAVLEMF